MTDRMNAQQILNRLGGEAFVGRLIAAIETIGLATDETGQKGKVTLTVASFKEKGSERHDGFVGYETKLVTVPPSPAARATGLYVSEDGLFISDPRQGEMDFRVVPSQQSEARPVTEQQPVIREA